jgi:sec-independent protein translocase protein TatA
MFGIGGSEIFFIVFIILMFFGSKKLPELARGLGKGLREMKEAANGLEKQITQEMKEMKDKTDLSDRHEDIKKLIDKE